jgi:hypothetical protein
MPMNPRLLRPIARSGDSDVRAYIAAVEQADTQPLEQAVKDAYRNFIVGCKADGIWSAIKSSCILMGARTLAGALTPLVGSSPTNVNNNFVSGDYGATGRKEGLKGSASKYIDTNFNRLSVGQDDCHAALLVPELGTANFSRALGCGDGFFGSGTGQTRILRVNNNTDMIFNHGTSVDATITNVGGLINFAGVSRGASGSYAYLINGTSGTVNQASQTRQNLNFFVFNSNPAGAPFNGRIAFYSIGTNLDLGLLSSRVTALKSAIGAAI